MENKITITRQMLYSLTEEAYWAGRNGYSQLEFHNERNKKLENMEE